MLFVYVLLVFSSQASGVCLPNIHLPCEGDPSNGMQESCRSAVPNGGVVVSLLRVRRYHRKHECREHLDDEEDITTERFSPDRREGERERTLRL